MEPLLLTPDQAAEALQISKSYLYELKSRNLIPYVKIGAMTTSTNYITVRRAAELAGVSIGRYVNGSSEGGCALSSLGAIEGMC